MSQQPYDDVTDNRHGLDQLITPTLTPRSSGLQPYTFTPGQVLSPRPKQTTAIALAPDAHGHWAQDDREMVRAAAILMSIYSSKRIPTEKGSIGEEPVVSWKKRKRPAQTQAKAAVSARKAKMTKPKADTEATRSITKGPAPKRGREKLLKDSEYFSNPTLEAINSSPAKKRKSSQQRQLPTPDDDNGDGDTTEIGSSSSESGDNRSNDEYIDPDTSPIKPQRVITLKLPSSPVVGAKNKTPKPISKTRSRADRYATPPSPSMSPLTHLQSGIQGEKEIVHPQTPSTIRLRSPVQISHTPPPDMRAEKLQLGSSTSLQRFLGEARASQHHRRSESLEPFYMRATRQFDRMQEDDDDEDTDEENTNDDEEDAIMQLVDTRRSLGEDKDSSVGNEYKTGNYAESDGLEEGEVLDDHDMQSSPPPRPQQEIRVRGLSHAYVLDY